MHKRDSVRSMASKKQKVLLVLCIFLAITGCVEKKSGTESKVTIGETQTSTQTSTSLETQAETQTQSGNETQAETQTEAETETQAETKSEAKKNLTADSVLEWNGSWQYADYSKIHSDTVSYYTAKGTNRKNVVVAINAGHGTSGGTSQRTLCHPDGSPKFTSGSTLAGATEATAISGGMTFLDGMPEATVTLKLAVVLKDILLEDGYDVLMMREDEDAQLDNIARTVFANNYADCHISLHYDSTDTDKGVFYIGVPDIAEYKAMEPVASHWQSHNTLGDAIISGIESKGIKIFGSGFMGMDLTQTSYSTIPSIDLEVGDKASDYSEETLKAISAGISAGLDKFNFSS